MLAVSLGAYGLMWLLIKRINATRVASLFYLCPPVTMFMAWLTFGDTITFIDGIGLAIVFTGVLLTQDKFYDIQVKQPIYSLFSAKTINQFTNLPIHRFTN